MVVLGTGASEKDGLKESETLCCSFLKDFFCRTTFFLWR